MVLGHPGVVVSRMLVTEGRRMHRLGDHGKVLLVVLRAQTSEIEEPGDTFWRLYAGGGLLATYYLLSQCPLGIDALAPENLLILTSSVMAGRPFVGLPRC